MLYTLSQVDEDTLTVIQGLEKDLGTTLLAMTPIRARPDSLSDESIDRVRAVEEALGVVLVAVDGAPPRRTGRRRRSPS